MNDRSEYVTEFTKSSTKDLPQNASSPTEPRTMLEQLKALFFGDEKEAQEEATAESALEPAPNHVTIPGVERFVIADHLIYHGIDLGQFVCAMLEKRISRKWTPRPETWPDEPT